MSTGSVRLSPTTSLDPTLIWAGIALAIAGAPPQEGAGYVSLVDSTGKPITPSNPLPVGQSNNLILDPNNSTTTPLAAGTSFVGTATDLTNYAEVIIQFYGTPSTAQGSLFFDFSPDAVNWDVSVPSLITDPTFFIPYPLIPVARYFRARYLNDGGVAAGGSGTPTNQTVFRFNTWLLREPTKEIARTLAQTIIDNQPVSLNRSVTMGKTLNSDYQNLPGPGAVNGDSSTTPLLANATFTGAFMDLNGYNGISVAVNTDQNGTLLVDNSIDGITVDLSSSLPVAGGTPFFVGITPLTRYMRIRFTNGSTNQVTFRLQTVAKLTPLPNVPDEITSATLNGLNQTVALNTTQGFSAIVVYVSNASTFVGTLIAESTIDGVNWVAREMRQSGFKNVFTSTIIGTALLPIDGTLDWRANGAGMTQFRIRCSAFTSGSCKVNLEASVGPGPVLSVAPFTLAPTTACVITTQTIGTTASAVSAVNPVNRKSIEFHARATNTTSQGSTVTNHYVFINTIAGVSSAQGRALGPGESWTVEVDETVSFFCVADIANQQFDITEVSN